ncbi:flagellin lysine-N-methylase [Ferrimonas sp. YFM]|uniref:flagellin lysine-N-methylase n=1 Tax=Ferrimonas sp. YFM TaxID=3028878 RepID=UPI0025746DEC|nr:flagellin lysine-N-methylase [Ferrimonas sp. YFM]BDY04422.1 lysine-N-methylase [Ferrimonas sp. YFM]
MSAENASQIFEPLFVRNFRCIGDQCPSNCCHSWTITLDKKKYKEARKSPDNVIKVLAKEHFKRLPSESLSDSSYGYIRLDNRGLCPMLDDKGWCEVHKRLGEKALSLTCQQYPRMPQYFGERLELSLTLSCPAVADAVLFDPDAMVMNQVETSDSLKSHFKRGGSPSSALPLWAGILRDFSFHVLLNQNLTLPERLFVLGLTYHQVDPHLENPLKVEAILHQNLRLTEDGSLRNAFASLPELKGHKWNIFSHQVGHITDGIRREKEAYSGLTPSERRFMRLQMPLVRQMAKLMGEDIEGMTELSDAWKSGQHAPESTQAFEQLLQDARPILAPFFAQNPQLLLNFLLYQIYHHQFLLYIKRKPIQFFQVLMVDLLLIEGYMAGIAVECGEINKDIAVALFSAYSKKRQHNAAFVDRLDKCLEESASDKLAAVFALLK